MRLNYIQHLTESFKEMVELNKNQSQIVESYLSLLTEDLLEEFISLKAMNPLSLEVEQVLRWMRRGQRLLEAEKLKFSASDLLWAICE